MSTESPTDVQLAALYEQIRADIATLDDGTRESVLRFYAGYRAYRVARSKGGMDEIATYADVVTTYPAARAAMDAFKSAAAPTADGAPEPPSTGTTAAPKTEASASPTPIAVALATDPLDAPAVITDAGQLATVPDGCEITVRLDALVAHPRNAVLLPTSSADEDERLAADIEAHGLVVPVVVAGQGCASPPGTLLDGHRRTGAMRTRGITEAKAVVRTGLTALDEEMWIVRSAIASQLHRKLTEEQKFVLEERARELLREKGHRQGRRSDLGTSVAGNGSSDGIDVVTEPAGTSVTSNGSPTPKGEASTIIANVSGEPESAVRQRQKIFGSPASTPALKDALATQKVSRKKAAAIVRQVEGAAETKLDTEAGVQAARSTIDERVREAIETLRGGPRTRRPKAEAKAETVTTPAAEVTPVPSAPTAAKKADTGVYFDVPTEAQDVEWSALGGAEVELLGHLVHFTRTDAGFRVEVVGRA